VPPKTYPRETTLAPFVREKSGHISVVGRLSDKPARLIVDTGASVSCIHIYIYRNETLGAALSMPITVNGKSIGSSGAKTFFKLDLPAGKHALTSQGDTSKLELVTEAGKLYFVWQEVKMGFFSVCVRRSRLDDGGG
jgi:hypothetical protein